MYNLNSFGLIGGEGKGGASIRLYSYLLGKNETFETLLKPNFFISQKPRLITNDIIMVESPNEDEKLRFLFVKNTLETIKVEEIKINIPLDINAETTGMLNISRGGTGASTKEGARNNLNIYSKDEVYKKDEVFTKTEADEETLRLIGQSLITDLLDVEKVGTEAKGEVLSYNGTHWQNTNIDYLTFKGEEVNEAIDFNDNKYLKAGNYDLLASNHSNGPSSGTYGGILQIFSEDSQDVIQIFHSLTDGNEYRRSYTQGVLQNWQAVGEEKANRNLDNITEDGKNVIKNLNIGRKTTAQGLAKSTAASWTADEAGYVIFRKDVISLQDPFVVYKNGIVVGGANIGTGTMTAWCNCYVEKGDVITYGRPISDATFYKYL